MKKNLLLLLIPFAVACQKDRDQVEELETEVLQIHDEVMPKMEQIVSLNAGLTKKIAALDSLQNEGITGNNLAQDRAKIGTVIKKLKESDSLMMAWMHSYDGDSAKKLKSKEAIAYFENEKTKIEKVKLFTDKSVEEARLILE